MCMYAKAHAPRAPSQAAPVLGLDIPDVARLALRSENAQKVSVDCLCERVRAPQHPLAPSQCLAVERLCLAQLALAL